MIKTIAHIDGTKVASALRAAKPVTAFGKVAVENYKRFLQNNTLTAIAIENSIVSLQKGAYDIGLEAVIATLKGVLPVAKRKVAIAYELIANENKAVFGAAGVEAEQALAALYEMNAAKIVDAINNGALDAYSTNPAIRSLISYANSALSDFTKATGTDLAMKTAITKLTPVLSIAVIDDASIVSIDNKLFVAGKRGSLAPVTDLSQYNLKGDIQMLLTVLSSMETTAEPNVLVLKSDFQKIAADNFMIKSFGIDLLATSDKFIIINDNAMSFDKADALLAANKSEIIASMLFNESATNVMKLIRSIMSTMDMYRGALLTNLYAKTVVADEVRIHVIKFGAGYSVVVMKGDVVIATSAYDDIMQVLADDYIVSNVEASNAFSNAFAADIEKATSKLSVKMKLVNDLIEERARYEALLEKINEEAKSLETIDANPEKVAALDELKGKVEEKLSIVVDEIAKLA